MQASRFMQRTLPAILNLDNNLINFGMAGMRPFENRHTIAKILKPAAQAYRNYEKKTAHLLPHICRFSRGAL